MNPLTTLELQYVCPRAESTQLGTYLYTGPDIIYQLTCIKVQRFATIVHSAQAVRNVLLYPARFNIGFLHV